MSTICFKHAGIAVETLYFVVLFYFIFLLREIKAPRTRDIVKVTFER